MIRIECPGCAATFTVPGAKAGQTGRCPTCGTQVPVPAADLPMVAADAPAPRVGEESVEVRPCPGCQARMAVARGDLGTTVECPYCVTRFLAESAAEMPPVPQTPRRERPPSRSSPPRRSQRRDETDDELEDDEGDRPRRRRRSGNSSGPNNVGTIGVMLVVGGILALVWTPGVMLYSGLFTCGVCCFWPGFYFTPVWAILAIVRGSTMTGGEDACSTPPLILHILQILLILNMDFINLILGIIGLVLSNSAPTQNYYARNGNRSDD